MANPLVDEAIDQDPPLPPRGSDAFLPCRCPARPMITPPGSSAATPADRLVLAQAEPGPAALLVLAYLRQGDTFAELAAGFKPC